MDMRDKLRQRRIERIRQLQGTVERSPYTVPPSNNDGKPAADLPYIARNTVKNEPDESSYPVNDRWHDPEYVWKQKRNMELSERYTAYNKDEGGNRFVPTGKNIRTKLLISCTIFALIWGMFHFDHPLANKGKAYVTAALNEPFNFQPVAVWYERQFGGTPTLVPALNPVKQQETQKVTVDSKHYFAPIKGKVIAPFEPTRLGVTLETKAGAAVTAMDTGLVVYAGSKEGTGFTVIIRHTGGVQSVYGWIEQSRVELNDWVKGGETIGLVSKNSPQPSGYLYFAVSKDNKFMNPADVVNFD